MFWILCQCTHGTKFYICHSETLHIDPSMCFVCVFLFHQDVLVQELTSLLTHQTPLGKGAGCLGLYDLSVWKIMVVVYNQIFRYPFFSATWTTVLFLQLS